MPKKIGSTRKRCGEIGSDRRTKDIPFSGAITSAFSHDFHIDAEISMEIKAEPMEIKREEKTPPWKENAEFFVWLRNKYRVKKNSMPQKLG